MKRREAYFILGMLLKNPPRVVTAEEMEALRLAEVALGSSIGWEVKMVEDRRLEASGCLLSGSGEEEK